MYEHIAQLGIPWQNAEKLIQELAWRDYWQQVWIARGDAIESDLKRPQEQVGNYQIPNAVIQANTGIVAIDDAIKELYSTGYLHNHMRMYVASLCCNIAQSHWSEPARWMYAHLLDGDLASNHLSWQWVAGSNSSKKYYANQDNINKFFSNTQKGTFLDVDYSQFGTLPVPVELQDLASFDLRSSLPASRDLQLLGNKTTLIYNYYNLDPNWYAGDDVQRILLLEPSSFENHVVSKKCIDFAIELAQNISEISLFVGEFEELLQIVPPDKIRFKEHPLNQHYKGRKEPREWLTTTSGYYPSFFAFWKDCVKQLKW